MESNMNRFLWLIMAALGTFALAACGGGNTPANGDNSVGGGGGNGGITKLRFSGIPDADKEKLTKQYEVVTAYLSEELGVEVEYVHAPDYNGAVTAFASNKIDVVWLGGVTTVQAEQRTNGEAVLLACRESDKQFKSYFIARKELGIGKLGSLKDIPNPGELSLTFGSKSSTSGHIMPRDFLNKAGMNPEKTFKSVGWQAQGGHSATLKAVQSGQAQVGALNFKTYENAAAGDKDQTEVIFETPGYVDYCMVGHSRLGDMNDKIAAAFTKLDASNPDHKKVLEVFQAENEKFVKAVPSWWDGIRDVLKETKLD
jgi:phosphonate transport system substrate-binding protein